jgi:glycosidase
MFFGFTFKSALAACFLLLLSSVLSAQTVPVSFNVIMDYQIEEGNFNPETQFVDIAGSFNGWDGGGYELAPNPDFEERSVYSIEIDFEPGEQIAFKFRIDGQWGGTEEFPGGGPNREFVVQSESEDNVILVWYSDEQPPTGPPIADFSPQNSTVTEGSTILFQDRSGGLVSGWNWYFEGGTPEVSDRRNPVVTYEQAGVYDVRLIASHEDLADTLYAEAAVTVTQGEDAELHWWNDTVFYEMFARSFFDSSGDGTGDFAGMTEKLDYLNDGNPETTDDLGIGGIWLMPIHDSPSYHGYDVLDYTSVHPDYGNMQEFRTFVEEAQSRGIKVIIDFVLNHSSAQHPWFVNSRNNVDGYRDYYRWRQTNPGYSGPWGQNVWHQDSSGFYYGLFWDQMPDLNYDNEEMKEKIFQAADFWLSDVGVDGFRLDAVTYIFEDGSNLVHTDETLEFWEEFGARVSQNNPDAVTVGEAWTNTEQILPYVQSNRLDLAFEFDLASAILNAVRSGQNENLMQKMQQVYNSYAPQQFASFLTNHDQNRVMDDLNDNWDQAKIAASIYLSLPGVPFLYYGEEIGMTGSKPDPQIRTPMQWTDGPQAGFTTGSPWINLNDDYELRNVKTQEQDENSLLNHYKKLIQLRNATPALRTGEYQPVISSIQQLFSFTRTLDNQEMLVIVNLDDSTAEDILLDLPPGNIAYQPGSHTGENVLQGTDINFEITPGNQLVLEQIEELETIILPLSESVPVSITDGHTSEVADQIQLRQNYPNPFNPTTRISYELPQSAEVRLEVFNALGQRVALLTDGRQTAGQHQVSFEASGLASGVYIYRLSTAETSITKKMLFLK